MQPILIIGLLALMPFHDFHTSVMNFRYQNDEKQFEIDLTLDSEHLEYVIKQEFDLSIRLGEKDEHPDCNRLIEKYLQEHISLWMNGKKKDINLLEKKVEYAETKLLLEPICHKRKLKQVSMDNGLMFNYFPGQKNLVNYYYKGDKKSMLFLLNNKKQEVDF